MKSIRRKKSLVGLVSATTLMAGIFMAPAAEAARPSVCNEGRVICVNKSTRQLSFVVDGESWITMDARFGSKVRNLETREGLFKVQWKSRHHYSKLYDSDMPYAMFFSGGQAIHYSDNFKRVGYRENSHGCVNVRDLAGIRALFNMVREGDRVYVHR
ncbi:MAG: L,D-transpeptidase [Sporichthyaceae bacterium]